MVTTLTDSLIAVRSVLSRVRSAFAGASVRPAMIPAMATPSAPSALAAASFDPMSTNQWLGGGVACGGHVDTYTTKRIHPGRLGGST